MDLKKGFIRLSGKTTKTKEGRGIPLTLTQEFLDLFLHLSTLRSLPTNRGFLRDKQPSKCFREAFKVTCQKAGIIGFRYHDLRYTAITNMRRARIDQLTIMWISGHKTMACFTRYNSFREPNLQIATHRLNT